MARARRTLAIDPSHWTGSARFRDYPSHGRSVKLTSPESGALRGSEGEDAVFVYGTLKRGELNAGVLASWAVAVEPASVRGILHDLGLYPAFVEGDGTVRGELVWLSPEEMSTVLDVLDRLEDYRPDDPAGSMYIRRVLAAQTDAGRLVAAHIYVYNDDPGEAPRLETGEWRGGVESPLEGDPRLAAFQQHVRTFASDGARDQVV